MRSLLAAAMIVVLTTPVYSQWVPVEKNSHWGPPVGRPLGERSRRPYQKTPKNDDRAYRSALDLIPDRKQQKNDPWQNVRGAPQSK